MSFNSVISSLSKEYSVNISKGKDLYAFLINNQHKVYVEHSPDNQSFVIYACVCDIPIENQQEIYKTILEANYFGTETDRSTLSIDKETGKIVLFRWFSDADTRYSEFIRSFSSFVGHLSQWKDKIQNFPMHHTEVKKVEHHEENIIKP
jgi:hypothetical protein